MTTLESHELARTIIHTLERMAFVLTEEVELEEALNLPTCRHFAHMRFTGPGREADLVLSASEGFMLEFTASMLGLEETQVVAPAMAVQSLLDLTEVVADEIATVLGGSEVVLRHGPPQVISELDAAEFEAAMHPELNCDLEMDGEVLRLRIYQKKENAKAPTPSRRTES